MHTKAMGLTGESLFLVCAQDSFNDQANYMKAGCKPVTDSIMDLHLEKYRDWWCSIYNDGNCKWIAPKRCGIGLLSGYTGCSRLSSYQHLTGGVPSSVIETRDVGVMSTQLNEVGAEWVDYKRMKCAAGQMFYREHFDAGKNGCIPYVDRYFYGLFRRFSLLGQAMPGAADQGAQNPDGERCA